jgi:CBS domain-containing protein
LKKLGTFPIVHGARALALQYRLDALSTVDRLRALADQKVLSATLARDLEETLHFLMTLKLRNNLRQAALGQPVGNLLQPDTLSTLEHDQLNNAMTIIKQFRLFLQLHYRLE